MTSSRLLLPAALLAVCVPAVHAQMPTDNLAWKSRCQALTAAQPSIESSTVSPRLIALTHGLPGSDFTMIALDRAQDGQHAVACTLFYLAAIAERSAAAADMTAAQNRLALANGETLVMRGEAVPVSTQVRRLGVQARAVFVPTPNPDQVKAVLDAASTVPSQVVTAAR